MSDPAELMADIRKKVKQDYEANKDKPKPFKQFAADINREVKAGEMVNSEELRYLNTHYAFGPNLNLDSINSHRPGLLGKLIIKSKRKLVTMIWDLLKGYFTAEREYHANLVRFLNDFTKYTDARDASNFWELIRKVDVDINRTLERVERIADEQSASLHSAQKRFSDEIRHIAEDFNSLLGELKASGAKQESQIKQLDSVVSGLESIAGLAGKRLEPLPETEEACSLPDVSYLLLENRFRGGEEAIKENLSFYTDFYKEAENPVLEIGPGRGELQQLFKEAGISARGVELDEGMAALSAERGLDVTYADGLQYLREQEDRSLGGVIAVQVVEHLTQSQLQELFNLSLRKVESGGKVIFETINPQSLMALSSNYFRDPTHVWPLHPDTVCYAMKLAGFGDVEVRYRSPVPEEAQLRKLQKEEFMTPRWLEVIDSLNLNIERLNSLLYGYQDYCVIAQVA